MKRALVCVKLIFFAALAALTISLTIAPFPVDDFASVQAAWHTSDAWLLDRHGDPLSRVRIDHQRRRGDWVAASAVSPALITAVLTSEDKRFYEHHGVDWLAMLGAIKQTASGERRGGSTLSMQLVAYLHPELETGGRRSVIDKWRQIRQASMLEKMWTKEQILEAWLNLTPFRSEIEGIDAAARVLLGKSASGLDSIDAALLAALVRAPNSSLPSVAHRACALLANDEAACLAVKIRTASGWRPLPVRSQIDGDAPHLAHELLKQPGQRLVTTLDAQVQRYAAETLQRHLRELEDRNVEDGALVVLDNATGDVVAWVGSSGELSAAQDVDGVTAPRQAGSTLKPFLYSLAIERKLLTAASILDDSPLAITTPAGLYVPQNYDQNFKGPVSLRLALASSLNVPAVRTLALMGYDPFYQRLRALGLETLNRDADHYGYALALGGADVTLLQLTNAYRTLSNGGRLTPVRTTFSEPAAASGVQIIDPAAVFIVNDILSDAAARALTFGLASPLATSYPASVKTGTSKDMRDNWAIGFTTRYTVGVWVGNFSGAPMHDVSGVSGAAPVWREVMDFLQQGNIPSGWPAPAGVVHQHITYANTPEPARDEWFVAGTETNRITLVETSAGRPVITSPSDGTIYALDPDIPRERQRITLTARGAPAGTNFVLDDGKKVRADTPFLWLPPPGRRQVALVDARGKELDRVHFEVRGLQSSRPLRQRGERLTSSH